MGNYLLAYTGGAMAETEAAQQAAMEAWGAWFGHAGAAMVDMGAPFDSSATLRPDGSTADGAAAGLTGYSVVSTDSLAAALEIAKGCPILQNGGSIQVYQGMAMG